MHRVGGILGTSLVVVFGTTALGGFGEFEMLPQLEIQFTALAVVILWSAVATFLSLCCSVSLPQACV
ncbi:hypothetical protein [Thalassobacterium sedimentorum]|uniref:hypothetical protein n=1 Tax=Thalassobacterium sedimentorum TaxID=3041258 RepID=UPI003CE54D40